MMKHPRTSRAVIAALATVLGSAGAGCRSATWPLTAATDPQALAEDALRTTVTFDPAGNAHHHTSERCGVVDRATASALDP